MIDDYDEPRVEIGAGPRGELTLSVCTDEYAWQFPLDDVRDHLYSALREG